MALALEEVKSLKAIDRRQAAEKAHLALTTAVEVTVNRNLTSHGEEKQAVKQIARRMRSPGFETTYHQTRKMLHGDCFHQAKCDDLQRSLGQAAALINFMLKSKRGRR